MSGSRESSQRSQTRGTTNQTQTESGGTSATLGSTPTALAGLPGYQQEFQESLGIGPYTGPVAAGFDYEGGVTPVQRDVSGFVSQASPLERQGIDSAVGGIQGLSGLTGETAGNVGQYWSDVTAAGPGGILESAPYQNLVNQIRTGAREQADYANAGVAEQFAGSGGWGGTEQARAATFLNEEVGQNLARQEGELGYNAFLFGHDLMGRAPSGAAAALGLSQQPGLDLMALGGAERGLDQLSLDEELAQANWAFGQEQQGIENELFQAGVQQANTQTDITNEMALNEALRQGDLDLYNQFFDTLTSGAFGQNIDANTISNIIGSSASTSAGTGTQGGSDADTASSIGSMAATAALMYMAFVSDERLKEDIQQIGKHRGLRWYVFRYTKAAQEVLGLSGKWMIGVMAQEVLRSPLRDAAFIGPNGFLMVDYRKVI